MKNIFYILLLLPTIIFAQYPSNSGQKITLGEQTTADGLVYRGIRADTTSKIVPFSDTSAYIILDTVEKTLWLYKAGQIPKWQQVGGSAGGSTFDTTTLNLVSRFGLKLNISDTSSMLSPYWRSGRFSGVLPVANGGTNTSTAFTAGSVVFAGAGGTYTQDNSGLFYNSTNKRLAIGQSQTLTGAALSVRGGLHIIDPDITNGSDNQMYIYPKEQTTAGPNATDFVVFVAGPESTTRDQGPYFLLRGNNFTRSTDQKGLIVFASGNNVPAAGNNGKILFQGQHGLSFDGASTFSSLAGIQSRVVLADANGLLSAPTSSITTKENVQVLNYGLNEILQLNPVSFDYIDKNKWGEERNLGFIVEDMYPIVPEVTGTMNNGDMYLDMVKLIPVLTKAIQEQQALIKALEQRILTLENK